MPLHRAGRLAEATALYRRVLVEDPANADALHLSAMAAYQEGHAAEALRGLRVALAVRANFAPAHSNLGNVLADLGRYDEALMAYAEAIARDDGYAEAHGNRATVLQRLGRGSEAAEAYARALNINPGNLTVRFNYGVLQRELGQIPAAANAFYAVVQADPSHSQAWRHLAICLRGLGHPDAEACLRRALADAPDDCELLLELGTLLNGQARHAEALEVLAPGVRRHPDSAMMHVAVGAALLALGRPAQAADHFRRALAHDPSMQGVYNNLGVALLDLDSRDEAVRVLRRAVALSPADPMVLNNHGTALDDRHDPEHDNGPSARWYRRAIRLRPDYGKAWLNLGGLQAARLDRDSAEELYRKAAACDPGIVESYVNLAAQRLDRDDITGAERLHRRALIIDRRRPAALTGLGLALQLQGRIAEAEAAHREALDIAPRHAEAAGNLGMLIWQVRQDAAEAEPLMTFALSIVPGLGTARLNRGLLRLACGRLVEGWEDYRWRFRAKGYVSRRIAAPQWRGEDPGGLRLLVWREQGVGDEIMFATCLAALVARAGHVVVECERRLVPLFSRSFPGVTVRAETVRPDGSESIVPPDVDAHVAAGDLPGLLSSGLADFNPGGVALVADASRSERWRERLSALGPGLRVGIGWRSQMMTTDRRASYVMLEHWGPVFAVPGVVFVNLQYGECEAELSQAEARFGVTIHRWADLDLKDDFDGAAALMANLDLVISPAMSAGELAGALGVPVWRFGSRDWTQLGTCVRPWYPSMRLFQPAAGQGLEDTLSAIARELIRMARPPMEPPVQVMPAARVDEAGSADRQMSEAIELYRGGDVEASELLARKVIGSTPTHPVALHLAGILAKRQGAFNEAADFLARAIAAEPANVAAHAALCEAFQGLGRLDDAEAPSRSTVVLQPDSAGHWVNRTALLRRMARTEQAGRTILRALRLRPDLAPAHGHRGELAAGPEAAVDAHRVAVALDPGSADMLSNLGVALQAAARLPEAARVLDHANRSDPRHAVARTNQGNVLAALGRLAEAEACHRDAVRQSPALAEAHGNLALLLQRQGRRADALAAFEAALTADPKYAQGHYNRSLLLLEDGALRAGWAGHDWRFGTPQFKDQRRRLAIRAWRGENIAGRRLLVWREQGVGDEILFASCYEEAIRRAGRLVIECDRRLVPLFSRSFPAADVRPETSNPRDADVQIAAGSLPRLLRPDLKRFPERPSWLVVDASQSERWRERLSALGAGLRVGIGWRSQIMTADRRASYVMLEHWGPVFAVPGVVFVNLQYGECEAELSQAEACFGVTIHRWADLDLKDDFDGAAALMANLDLVISPAMSAGELAGALGVPVWRFGNRDWTQLGTGVRPWYPSMRLFQPAAGQGLEDTLSAIARELIRMAAPPRLATSGHRPPDPGQGRDAEPGGLGLLEQAVAAHRAGNGRQAADLYERVLAERPRDPVALHLSGLLAHQHGDPARGEPRIAAAIAAMPDYATAHISLGSARLALGRAAAATVSFRVASALCPDDATAQTNLGNALHALGHDGAALQAHSRAVSIDPSLAEAHDNQGVTLGRLGRWVEAERAHALAMRLSPVLASAWLNRSVALRRLGRLGEAEAMGRLALALDPMLADAMASRGRLLRETGDDAAALLWCTRALAVVPGHPVAAFNRSMLDLVAGRLPRGWDGYDCRFKAPDLLPAARRPGVPPWNGEDPAALRLLVWREQGIGDELMFVQLLPLLIGRARHVVLECDPRFVPLFARSFPEATVMPAPFWPDLPAVKVDRHVAIGSLARHLARSLAGFARIAPVLRADPTAVERWRSRLAALGEGLKVGIAWRSGQLDPDRVADYTRIEDWKPVLDLPGIVLVNLQYGDCAGELATARQSFGRAPHAFPDLDLRNDLDGAAALMAALDLVVAPATSTGELAAALGVPVWRLARQGDWTTIGTSVRPWFASMRLFRTAPGAPVSDLLPAVAAELVRLRLDRA
nr:tetratricopeptide repeat protein [Azospirillum picis]